MRGTRNTPQDPQWAPAGKWDWTVALSLAGSIGLYAYMLIASPVGHHPAAHAASMSCVPDRHDVGQLIGPAAWTTVTDCVLLSGSAAP